MQKIQQLTDCGKVKNYVWKYVGKIDKNYYVVVNVDGKGDLVTKALFLHNTKVVTSKIKNDKARKKIWDNSRVQDREISEMEMCHVIIKYTEVFNDLNFVAILTLPLYICASTDCKRESFCEVEDGAYIGLVYDNIFLW